MIWITIFLFKYDLTWYLIVAKFISILLSMFTAWDQISFVTFDTQKAHDKATDKWHMDHIRVHMSDIWVTFEWHMDDIRVHKSDKLMSYTYVQMTCGWHTGDIRITWELM